MLGDDARQAAYSKLSYLGMEPAFEKAYRNAVQSGLLPGAVLLASSLDGSFQYEKSFGNRSKIAGRDRPVTKTDIFALASCSKLMTNIAVLQCVENGYLELDTDVRAVIPEVYTYGIITGWDKEKNAAVLAPITRMMTLRHLITGSSGISYEAGNPLLNQWRASRNEGWFHGKTIEEKCTIPLLFEPGTGWAYGGGWDWAGRIVERVTDMSLEDYMQKFLWSPLGLKDCTFWPQKRSDYDSRKADMNYLKASGEVISKEWDPTIKGTVCCGGAGIYASPADYLDFLLAVLRRDKRLLRKATFQKLFEPQLDKPATQAFSRMFDTVPGAHALYGTNLPESVPRTMSFGGLLCQEDVPGAMRRGTIQWSGLPCLVWFVDSQANICGLAWSQVMPTLAPPIHALHSGFQHGIYEVYEAQSRAKMRTSSL